MWCVCVGSDVRQINRSIVVRSGDHGSQGVESPCPIQLLGSCSSRNLLTLK